MNISLKNKTALVGGSTQGLGKAVAMQLAVSGATVTLMARNEEKLKQVLSELPTPEGQKHQYLKVDFSDFTSFKNIVAKYFENHTIDILVNNTNGPSMGTALEKNAEEYQSAFDLLFQTVCYTSLQAIPHMQQQNFGRIINMSSVTVKEPLPHLVLSNSIRSALGSWAKTMAALLAVNNITINNILTGYFETERLQSIMNHQAAIKGVEVGEIKNFIESGIPMKRLGNPEEYGYLVAFLVSENASYITCSNIPIDGGFLKCI